MFKNLRNKLLASGCDYNLLDAYRVYDLSKQLCTLLRPFLDGKSLDCGLKRAIKSDTNYKSFYDFDKFKRPQNYYFCSFGFFNCHIECLRFDAFDFNNNLYDIYFDNFVFDDDFLATLHNLYSFAIVKRSGYDVFTSFLFYDCVRVFMSIVDYVCNHLDMESV